MTRAAPQLTRTQLLRSLVGSVVRDLESRDETIRHRAWRWLTSPDAESTVSLLAPDWYWEFVELRNRHHHAYLVSRHSIPAGLISDDDPGGGMPSPCVMPQRRCEGCHLLYTPWRKDQRYCSLACSRGTPWHPRGALEERFAEANPPTAAPRGPRAN